MSDFFEQARVRADESSTWTAPVVYACLGILAATLHAEPTAIGASYFEAMAQLLPVLVLALVLDQTMLIGAVPGAVEAMRSDLRRRIDKEPCSDVARALVEGAQELERRAAALPQNLLASSVEVTRTPALFACAELVALYALASKRYSWAMAVYCALAMALVIWQLIISARARAIGEGAVAQIKVLELLEGRDVQEQGDDASERGS